MQYWQHFWTLNLQVQLLNYIRLSGKQQRNRDVISSKRRSDSRVKWAQRQVWHLPLPETSQPKQPPTSGAVNQRRQHRMVIYFRCSLLGCDLNFKDVTIQTKKNQKKKKNSQTEASWRSGCHTNRPMISFCLLRGEKSSVLLFLSTADRYLIVCSIKSNLFLVTNAGFERDGAHSHGTALNSVSAFCFIRKRCAETTDSDGELVEMCLFCLFDSGSACYLCSPRIFYRTGISMQDHTVRNTQMGPVHQTNYIHRWRTGNIFRFLHVSVGNMQKSLLIVAFVLNAWGRQCGSSKYTLVGGKSPTKIH